MIISVAGNICSGKTTLSKYICDSYGFSYVPEKRSELFLLDAFFNNVSKYFLSTQLSFVFNKIIEINEHIKMDRDVVVDRSLYEDVSIFAQMWIDKGIVSEEDKDLYKNVVNYLVNSIPKSDVYIICRCSSLTVKSRFEHRPRRSFETHYPAGFLDELNTRYSNLDFPQDALVIEIDTDLIDLRDEGIVSAIINCINNEFHNTESIQLSIWDSESELDTQLIHNVACNSWLRIVNRPKIAHKPAGTIKQKKKQIYLAAPFTEFANEKPDSNSNQLRTDYSNQREYNIIPSYYRRLLNRIKNVLSFNGLNKVVLPHKDENQWGKRYISGEQVVNSMIDALKRSDLLVAIVSNSIGVHMELAMMAIQNKPMVLIVVNSLTKGFYANGFENKQNVLLIKVDTINHAYSAINSLQVKTFIRSQLYEKVYEKTL